jgi:hypothetical protein
MISSLLRTLDNQRQERSQITKTKKTSEMRNVWIDKGTNVQAHHVCHSQRWSSLLWKGGVAALATAGAENPTPLFSLVTCGRSDSLGDHVELCDES